MNFKYPDFGWIFTREILLCPLLTPNLECPVTVAKKRCPLHRFAPFCFVRVYFQGISWGAALCKRIYLKRKSQTSPPTSNKPHYRSF